MSEPPTSQHSFIRRFGEYWGDREDSRLPEHLVSLLAGGLNAAGYDSPTGGSWSPEDAEEAFLEVFPLPLDQNRFTIRLTEVDRLEGTR